MENNSIIKTHIYTAMNGCRVLQQQRLRLHFALRYLLQQRLTMHIAHHQCENCNKKTTRKCIEINVFNPTNNHNNNQIDNSKSLWKIGRQYHRNTAYRCLHGIVLCYTRSIVSPNTRLLYTSVNVNHPQVIGRQKRTNLIFIIVGNLIFVVIVVVVVAVVFIYSNLWNIISMCDRWTKSQRAPPSRWRCRWLKSSIFLYKESVFDI